MVKAVSDYGVFKYVSLFLLLGTMDEESTSVGSQKAVLSITLTSKGYERLYSRDN